MTAGENSPMAGPGKPRVAVFTLGGTIAIRQYRAGEWHRLCRRPTCWQPSRA